MEFVDLDDCAAAACPKQVVVGNVEVDVVALLLDVVCDVKNVVESVFVGGCVVSGCGVLLVTLVIL